MSWREAEGLAFDATAGAGAIETQAEADQKEAAATMAAERAGWCGRSWIGARNGGWFLPCERWQAGVKWDDRRGGWSARIDGKFSREVYPTEEAAMLATFDEIARLKSWVPARGLSDEDAIAQILACPIGATP